MCDYYTKENVIYRGVSLDNDVSTPKLHLIREIFLTQLILEIEKYFPEGQVKYFDIFLPRN